MDQFSTAALAALEASILLMKNPKMFLTAGPAKNICQHKAIGKLITVVWSHTAMSWLFTPLKSTVAMKLITGHIIHTIIEDIAHVINSGLSCGVMKRNASAGARR